MYTMVVFNIHYSFTVSPLLSQPMNTVTVARSRVKMECSRHPHAFPVDWEFAPAGSNDFSLIYTSKRISDNLSSRYKIDTDNRTRYDIVIDSVDLSHAGTYRCTPITEEVVNLSSYSAELTVLASEPVCVKNASALNDSFTEGDNIRMWCAISYLGNYHPFMEWTVSTETAFDVDVYDTDDTTVIASLTIQLNSRHNGVTFTCNMSFKPNSTQIIRTRRPTNTLATNAPQYQLLWNLTLNVLYAPRNLTLIPKKIVYDFGEQIVCWANGNPTPSYEWMEIETNKTIQGSILTIDKHARSEKNHHFRCIAYNTIAGVKREIAYTITFILKGSPTSSEAGTVVLTVAGIIAVISLVSLGIGVTLTVKACAKSNSVNRESAVVSIQHQDYEMVADSNIQSVDGQNLPPNQSTPYEEEDMGDHSGETIVCEAYSALKRSSPMTLAQPPVYAQLQLYANIQSSE